MNALPSKNNNQKKEKRGTPAALFASSKLRADLGAVLICASAVGFLALALYAPLPNPQHNQYAQQETWVLEDNLPQLSPNTLSIPSLNIEAPLLYPASGTNEAGFQKELQNGVVHYPNTANPGEKGNAYYFGHSSDYAWAKGSYKEVFRQLPEIATGADIYISNESTTYHYRVRETRVIESNDTSVLTQGDEYLLTLQTSYPVGTAQKRFIAIAELVQVKQ